MLKNKIKLFIFAAIAFLIISMPDTIFAKTMTLTDIEKEIEKYDTEDMQVENAFIIGDYVFTSAHELRVEDIMLAAQSILTEEKNDSIDRYEIRNKMNIYQLERIFNSDDTTGGWNILNNKVGKTKIENSTSLNIRYIDYEYVSDDTKIEVSLDGINTEKFNSKFTKNAENLALDGSESEKKLSGMIELNDKVDTSIFTDSSYLTKHYFAFKLKVNNEITDKTTVKITYPDGKVDSYTGKSKFDDASQGIMTILAHLDSSKDPKDQIITIEVDLDGDGKLYSATKYTIDCSEVTFQEKSKATDNEIASLSNISESDVNILQNEWKYDLSNIGNNIKLVKGDDGNYTLTGDIKQQTLADGIFKEKQGYYIPVKIFGPKDISSSNWNIQVHDETETEPNWLTRTPDSTDYTNNYMVILFKIKEDGDKITYKIDWDGNENKYLPIEVTIDYSSLTFLKQHSIKFKYNNKETNVTVWDNEKIATDKIPTTEEYAYHEFVYWQENEDSDGTKVDLTTKTFDTDIILVPHWRLLADDFIDSEISKVNAQSDKNFELALEKASNTITVCTDKQNVNLNELTKTSLSDAIYNVLQKGEIKSIDIELEQTKTFTKSNDLENIKNELNTLFEGKTLDKMAIDNTTIKVKLTANNNVDLTDTEYTLNFKFVSDTMVVKNEAELKQALKLSMIKNILIDNDIQLTEENKDSKHTHTLFINIDDPNRKVTIKSKDDSNFTIIDNDVTTEGDGDVTPVIQVDKGNVTFENLKIKGATRAISVKSGATVTAKNVNAIGSQDAAFDVAEGATFNGTDLKYTTDGTQNKESYHYPTICGHGTVNITNGATKVENYKRIVAMKDSSAWTDNDFRDPETGKYYPEFVEPGTEKLKDEWQQHIDNGDIRGEHSDSLSTTNHTHYYLDGANSKYYEVYFWDSRVRLIIFKYYGINDEIVPPKDNVYKQSDKATDFHFFIKAYVDKGETTAHVHDGWVNQSGEKVDKFKVSGDPTKAEVYYTRFVDGYRVTLPIKVNGTDKTGVFGIVKDTGEMKIKDLINSDPDFAKYYQELKTQAAGKKIVEKTDHTTEVNEETVISKNMDLEIIETLQKSSVIEAQVSGLSQEGNNISGTIMTQNDKNEFIMPITLKSNEFQEGVTQVIVTDPNGNSEKYTYSESSKNGVAPVSTANEMTIELNAIKSSLIKNNGKKEYTIKVDIDGENNDEYAIKNLTINYEQVKTIEEIINEAAENTQNARRLTVNDNSKIRNVNYGYTRIYDKDTGRRYSIFNDGTESYTFPKNTFYESSSDKARIDIDKKKDCNYQGNVDNEYYLNGWRYNNSFSSIGYGVSEIELLRDAIKDAKNINAISTVKETGENTYEIIVSVDRFNAWLNTNYADFDYIKSTVENNYQGTVDSESGIKFTVTLTPQKDGEDRYISSIKSDTFTINKDSTVNSTDNVIDLTISNVNQDGSKVKSLAQIIFGDDADDETYKTQLFDYLKEGEKLKSK